MKYELQNASKTDEEMLIKYKLNTTLKNYRGLGIVIETIKNIISNKKRIY